MTNAKNTTSPGSNFNAHERWCATGDSLTHSGFYHEYIQLYYATRFPENRLDHFNCGINGNKVSNILARLEGDILIHKPTLVTVLIGMNDVGQIIPADKPDAYIKEQRTKDVVAFGENMRVLLTRLQAAGIRTLLITPPLYDETLVDPKASAVNPGHQGALLQCAVIVRELGAEFGVAVIDWNRALADWNRRLQKENPAATLVGLDRVHPGETGHLVMAYEFLKAQGAPREVSRITINALTGQPGKLVGCTIGKSTRSPGRIGFECLEAALPFPVPPACQKALEFLPFTDDLNREILQVEGLDAGTYQVWIDGIAIRTCSAEQLREGINLAVEISTPQYRQAQVVQELVARRAQIYRRHLRCIAEMEWGFLESVDLAGKTLGELKELLDGKIEKEKGQPWYDFCKQQAVLYAESKPHEQTYRGEIDVLLDQIHWANKPHPHHIEVSRCS